MDIGEKYRRGLMARRGRGKDCAEREPANPACGGETVSRSQGEVAYADCACPVVPTVLQADHRVSMGMMVDVEDIVEAAYRELETARQKAETTLANARSVSSRIYKEARREARRLLSKARQKSERLETIGKSRGERARRQAFDEGFEEGCRQGMAKAEELTARALDELARFTGSIERAQGEFALASDERMARLMMTILRKVVGSLDKALEGLLLKNLSELAAEAFAPAEKLVLRCHPADLERIDSALAAVGLGDVSAAFDGRRIVLRTDSSLSPGQCRLCSDERGVSFSFDERLTTLERELLTFVRDGKNGA